MKIEAFLQRAGQMAMDDTLVAFTQTSSRDGFNLWLDAGNRYLRTFISGLEVMQNQLDMTGFWPLQPLEPGCNPRCFKEHMKGFDVLHVGPTADVVFKEGHENDGTPFGRVSGPDDTPHCGRCARNALRNSYQLHGADLTPSKTEEELRLGWAGHLTMQPKRRVSAGEVQRMMDEAWVKLERKTAQATWGDIPFKSMVDTNALEHPEEGLTGAPAVAAMDKAGRQQLRMLVNEKLPTHLLGAPINSVKEALMGNAVEVTVAGGRDSYLLMAKELDAAGLTVAKAVALCR